MVHLYLIRHAESETNVNSHLINGRSDHSPLTAHGKEQARMLGEYLKSSGIHFDEIHSSTAVRTVSTAEIVCSIVGYPLERIVKDKALLELSQGEWVGRLRAEVYTLEQLAIIDRDNGNFKAPGGESQYEVRARMTNHINRTIIEKYGTSLANVAVFGHGVAIKCFINGIFGFDSKYTHAITLPNTSTTHLAYEERGWYPITVNNTEHLLLDFLRTTRLPLWSRAR